MLPHRKFTEQRKKALFLIEGNTTEQFGNLRSYAAEILQTNLGTTVTIKEKLVPNKLLEESKFKRIYICWGALKKGFLEGCRPIISLDGCHLKGPYGGILLTAIGVDANNYIYPFAYAMVDKEKKKTWQWFLELLGQNLNI